MRIAWLNEHFLFWNGGIRYIYEVCRRLAKEYSVKIYSLDISSDNYKKFSDASIEMFQYPLNVKTIWYWILYPICQFEYANFLSVALKKYDVVFSSSPTTHILCLLTRIKPILVVFELNPWLYSKEYQSGLSPLKRFIVMFWSPIAKYMEKKAYQNAIKIIAYSKFVQSEIKRVYGVDSEVVYTGIDTEFFKKMEV